MRNPIAQAPVPLLSSNNTSNAQNGTLPVAVTRALQQATQGVQIYRPPHVQRQKSADLLVGLCSFLSSDGIFFISVMVK